MSGDPARVPQAAALREHTLDSEMVFRGTFLNISRDLVRLANGAQVTREYIRHSGAVMIIPLLDNGKVLMERQFRTPMQRVMVEFPAGKLDAGESWLACAQRELREALAQASAAHEEPRERLTAMIVNGLNEWICCNGRPMKSMQPD